MQEKNQPFGKVSENIRAALSTKGLNQNQLAELANISYVTISRYMSGTRTPGTEELYRMAQTLDVSMEFLLTGRKDADSTWKLRALAAEQKLSDLRGILPLYAEINGKFTELNSKLTKLATE